MCDAGKRRYSIKLWKTFTDCFNCLPIAAIIDDKIFCCHGGRVKHTHTHALQNLGFFDVYIQYMYIHSVNLSTYKVRCWYVTTAYHEVSVCVFVHIQLCV